MITHIIFDNNGVLTTSDKERTYGLVSDLLGCTIERYIALLNKFVESLDTGKMTQDNFYAAIIKEGRFSVSVNELRRVHLSGYINKPEVQKFAEKMVGKYIIALLSNFGNAFWEMDNKVWHLSKIFSKDKMFVSADIGMRKPYEDIYLYTLAKLKTKAENCVFIDDNEENIKTAKRLGFKTIHFTDLEKCKKELNNFGITA